MLDPQRSVAIVSGASAWPNVPRFEPASAYRNTAFMVHGYLVGQRGLQLPEEHILDLFDSEESVLKQYRRIRTFLEQRRSALNSNHGEGMTIVFWYVGHGALLGPNGSDYCLLVRDTEEMFGPETSIRVAALGNGLKRLAPLSSRIVVLDCCHAGEAAHLLQGGVEGAMAAQLSRAIATDRGVALLAASSAEGPARLESSMTLTLFGRAALSALAEGSPQHGQALSLRDVRELIHLRLLDSGEPNFPLPEVHSPSQPSGDLAAQPFFPNFAFAASSYPDAISGDGAVDLISTVAETLTPRGPGPSVSELHQRILEEPLVEALGAARALAAPMDRDLTGLLAKVPEREWRRRLVRLAIQGDPRRVAQVLVDRLLKADHDWHQASSAVLLLSPGLHDHAAHIIGGHLQGQRDIEASRMYLEALGRLGAAGYAREIVRYVTGDGNPPYVDPDGYEWNKWAGYVPIALARMVRWCEDNYGSASDLVRDSSMRTLASFLADYGDKSAVRSTLWDVYKEMRALRAWHADALISVFLRSTEDLLVDVGAVALGHMHLAHAVPALIERLNSDPRVSQSVERTLLLELARIGGPQVVEYLRGPGKDRLAASSALHRCLDSAPDAIFAKLVHESLAEGPEEAWWIYRAIGRRPLPTLVDYLNDGLTSGEPSARGVAALALAKAHGPKASERLQRAHDEASAPIEQALTAVAVLVSSGDYKSVRRIEDALAEDVWQFEAVLFEDVVSALEGWGRERGTALATGLRWLSTAP